LPGGRENIYIYIYIYRMIKGIRRNNMTMNQDTFG
jgi:hypothetical protein